MPKSRNVGTLPQKSLIKSEAKFIAGHRPSGIQYLSSGIRAFRYRNGSPYSGTGLVPASAFSSFLYRTDQMLHYPAFQHLKKRCIHPGCPHCNNPLGYTLHVNRVHPSLLVVERVVPCTCILLAVEWDTPCTSILLAVERDTHCTSILLAVERNTPCTSKDSC